MKAVHITWYDPYSIDGWEEIDDLKAHEPMLVESFGYEVHRSSKVTIITQNYDDKLGHQKGSCSTVIPECCIESYQVVKVHPKKKAGGT